MVPVRRSLQLAFVLWALALTFPALAQSQTQAPASIPTCDPWAARLVSYQGTLSTRRVSGFQQASVRLNETFCVGDVLEIGAFSRAALQLPDQTVVRLDQGTVVTFAAPKDEKRTWLDILKGAVHIISRDPRALRVITPFANAGIEGTEFFVGVGGDATTVIVFEGRVKVENAAGAASAGSGESVLARTGSAPVLQQVVRPRDAVNWTLYFPPTNAGPLPMADAQPTAAQMQSAAFYIGRAEQRLAAGQLVEAEADLDTALKLEPGSGEVLARQSVVALTRNDYAAAVELADSAVKASPDSVAAQLAQSYARQAGANLPGAIASLEAAAAIAPDSALVHARLAELWLASGEVERSEAEASAAVAADPQLPLAHTVLGFVMLTRIDLGAAKNAFGEAIRLQPDAPLPRLGLGLATIRGGDLKAGREEIETAVILHPGNSLIRSYIGKAYYDEKRNKLSASQLELAKELDPLDPTPWFYDAIRRQTTNDPAGALESIEASIARNDDRAVYRSRLLLDEDLAARSSALGRIYQDLDFDELAFREGWKSVDADPSDYSGHRLLADTYGAIPRYEIARVNELQQSQLLQPLNMTPVAPQLGEANLFILDSAGPSAVSYNEFNPLFSRDGFSVQSSAVAGGNGIFGADGVVSGIQDSFSFSLGGFYYTTDGFRDNNDLDQNIFDGLFQYRTSPSTTWLAETRFSHRDQGDLRLLFDENNFNSDLRQGEDVQSLRLGVRHDLSPQSTLLLQGAYQNVDLSTSLGTFFSQDQNQDIYSAEAQYTFRTERWYAVAGLRYRVQNSDATTNTNIPIPDPPFELAFTDISHPRADWLSAYAYAQIDLSDQVALTLGLDDNNLDGQVADEHKLYPKIGLRWEPDADTIVRVGAFRTIREFAFSRQDIAMALEPTQVVGFNQLFADSEGVEAWRYGLGVDHSFSPRLKAGIEATVNDADLPYFEAQGPPDFGFAQANQSSDSYQGRSYLYWLPTDTLATAIGYQYFRQNNDPPGFPYNSLDVTTQLIPLSVRLFLPNGLGAGLTTTWVDQNGKFYDSMFNEVHGNSKFAVVDAALTFRLPKRYGLVGLEVKNLFDNTHDFQDIDPENPRITPERLVLFKVTLAL